jgi:hypothetical protein
VVKFQEESFVRVESGEDCGCVSQLAVFSGGVNKAKKKSQAIVQNRLARTSEGIAYGVGGNLGECLQAYYPVF